MGVEAPVGRSSLFCAFSSVATRAARTSGARDSHMSTMDPETVGETFTALSSSLQEALIFN